MMTMMRITKIQVRATVWDSDDDNDNDGDDDDDDEQGEDEEDDDHDEDNNDSGLGCCLGRSQREAGCPAKESLSNFFKIFFFQYPCNILFTNILCSARENLQD